MPAVNITSAKRIRTFRQTQPLATNAAALVTSGAGLVFSVAPLFHSTAAASTFIALIDSSAVGTACYEWGTTSTSATRLLALFQASHKYDSAGTAVTNSVVGEQIFHEPIPFFDGLVVASVDIAGTAAGSTAVSAVVRIYAPATI